MFMKLFQKNKILLVPRFLLVKPWIDLVLANRFGKNFIRLINHPIILGSSIIFLGSIFGNFFNFLFNLFISRNLSIEDYGVVASLLSLMTLFALPVGAIIPTIVYFSADAFGKGDLNLVKVIYKKITKVSFFVGVIIFLFFLIFNGRIGQFFHIKETNFIMLSGVSIFIAFIGIANQPLLQAKLSFRFLSFTNTLSAFIKLVFGISLVFFGFSVGGILWAIIFASVTPYFLSFFQLKFLFYKRETVSAISFKNISYYGAPAALATIGLTSLITFDIILVKHFFNPTDAGIYAILSLIGRVVYYFSSPIASVMFPLIVQKHVKGEKYQNDLKLSLFLVFVPSACIVVFYALFPEFIVTFFSQKFIPAFAIKLIVPFAILTSLYSLLTVLSNFFLSINKVKIFIPILIGSLLQIILISIFHESFTQIIAISIIITGLLLIILLLYYWRLYGKNKK